MSCPRESLVLRERPHWERGVDRQRGEGKRVVNRCIQRGATGAGRGGVRVWEKDAWTRAKRQRGQSERGRGSGRGECVGAQLWREQKWPNVHVAKEKMRERDK